MSVADNLKRVKESIAEACVQAGREVGGVKLIAVSKTKPLTQIEEAFRAGQLSFGENYVQEAVEKSEKFPQAEWHFIGSLQTNKVKLLGAHFALVHSVDREKLALELASSAEKSGRVQDVLLQVHIGDENTKHGVSIADAPRLIEAILNRKSLRLRGLMSLPPLSDNEKSARGFFSELRRVFEDWKENIVQDPSFTELSMGTSSDYEWAILEGATLVRVGTAIFGAR